MQPIVPGLPHELGRQVALSVGAFDAAMVASALVYVAKNWDAFVSEVELPADEIETARARLDELAAEATYNAFVHPEAIQWLVSQART
jgi:hypothetical protein